MFLKGRIFGRRKDSQKVTGVADRDKVLQGQSREERNGLGFSFALDVILTYFMFGNCMKTNRDK